MASITGTIGAETLTGTSGDDVIDGLGGAATLTGGAGHDQFVLDPSYSGTATITDFQSGVDQLVIYVPVSGNYVIVSIGDNRGAAGARGGGAPAAGRAGATPRAG